MAKKTLKKMASGHSNKKAIYAAAGANMQSKGKLWKAKDGKRTKSAGKVKRSGGISKKKLHKKTPLSKTDRLKKKGEIKKKGISVIGKSRDKAFKLMNADKMEEFKAPMARLRKNLKLKRDTEAMQRKRSFDKKQKESRSLRHLFIGR